MRSAQRAGRSVFVTGARGYLGGRICRALAVMPGWRVTGTSRRSDPPPGWAGERFVRLDLSGGADVIAAALTGVDAVVHLASADRAAAEADPAAVEAAAVRASGDLLQAAAAAGVGRVIYMSTVHVYGTPLAGRIDEHRMPHPAHPYAAMHLAAEAAILAAHRAGRIDGVVLRLSNAIGAPASSEITQWGLLGNELCRRAVTEGVLRLRSGEPWRDYITVADVASAVAHVLTLPRAAAGDGLFNLGGAMPLRVIDVAERVADRAEALFGRRPEIVCPPGEPQPSLDYRIDKIRATGWRPTGRLEDELDATLRLCAESFL